MRHIAPVLALAITAALLYGVRLNRRPLQPGEVLVASQSSALVENGWRDLDGRFLPILVHAGGERWLPPLPVYASAVMPGRSAAALAGTVDVVLMYLLTYLVFRRQSLASIAGVVLLLTPAHTTYSRIATTDGVWQLPFVLTWLVGLAAFVNSSGSSRRWLVASVSALAFSMYAQPSAALMVPVFLATTVVVLYRGRCASWVNLVWASAAFAGPLVPLLVWFIRYPGTYLDTFARWFLAPAHIRNPIAWAQAVSNWLTMQIVSETYWDFLSPFHLFIDVKAPGLAGVFLTAVGVAMAMGIRETLKEAGTRSFQNDIRFVALAGFLIAPLAAATFRELGAVQRTLVMAPFGALLATAGIAAIWERKTTATGTVAILLLMTSPVQFTWYYLGLLRSP